MKFIKEYFHPKTHWLLLWMITGLVCYAFVLNTRVGGFNASNALITQEISTVLDPQIKEVQGLRKTKRALIERLAVIQQLQEADKPLVVLLDFLSRLDDSIALLEVKFDGHTLFVSGRFTDELAVIRLSQELDNLGFKSLERERSYRIMERNRFSLTRKFEEGS